MYVLCVFYFPLRFMLLYLVIWICVCFYFCMCVPLWDYVLLCRSHDTLTLCLTLCLWHDMFNVELHVYVNNQGLRTYFKSLTLHFSHTNFIIILIVCWLYFYHNIIQSYLFCIDFLILNTNTSILFYLMDFNNSE